MFGILIFVHTILSLLLITVILLQSGRSGGLTETFGGAAESLFGTKTNAFMVRTTAVLSTLFIVSCLTLAYLSKEQSKSLMERAKFSKTQKTQAPAQKEEAREEKPQSEKLSQNAVVLTTNQIPEATPGESK